MLIRLVLIALLAPAAAQDDIETRIAALRADLAAIESVQPQNPKVTLERALLTSLERRRDLARAEADTRAIFEKPPEAAASPPTGMLEADDLRRRVQELELSIDAGVRRLDIVRADRAAAAGRLEQTVADLRQLEDGTTRDEDRIAQARLEVDLAESTTAELDAIIKVVELQQQSERGERDAIAQRLGAATAPARPTAEEIAEIDRRLAARSAELTRRLAEAGAARDAAFDELQRQAASAAAPRLKTLKEQLATRDLEIEIVREALSNLTIERAVWQLAIRYWRDGDSAAVVEARTHGPMVREGLARRLDFMRASFDQVAAQAGAIATGLSQAPTTTDAADQQALRATLEQRMRLIEEGMLGERRVMALIDRLRSDFDARISVSTLKDRLEFAWESSRTLASQFWNFELFVVKQTVDVNGRQTEVPRGVTVAKVVKAPLLLIVSLFLAYQLTRVVERYALRRGVVPASARLTRRWTFGLLACACALASLAIAGIPLAAFAFVGGAVAIGVGFGMQTLFKNLISGVLVLIERPFRLGDEIQIGSLRGTVVDIDLRASVVRDSDGSETLIPNSSLVEQNVTARPRTIRQTLSLTVDTQSDPREVSDAMRSAAERHGLLDPSRKPEILLDDFPGDGLRFSMNYWIDAAPGVDRPRVASDLRLMILNAFGASGIRLAQGQVDLRLRTAQARKIADAIEE